MFSSIPWASPLLVPLHLFYLFPLSYWAHLVLRLHMPHMCLWLSLDVSLELQIIQPVAYSTSTWMLIGISDVTCPNTNSCSSLLLPPSIVFPISAPPRLPPRSKPPVSPAWIWQQPTIWTHGSILTPLWFNLIRATWMALLNVRQSLLFFHYWISTDGLPYLSD